MQQVIDFPPLLKYNPLDIVMVKPTETFNKPRIVCIASCVYNEAFKGDTELDIAPSEARWYTSL